MGWDKSKWRTENHFVSWLRQYPDNRVSVHKVIGKGRSTNNRLRLVAQFRRLRTRLGAPDAIRAMGAKPSRPSEMQFDDEETEGRHCQREINSIKRKAANLGYQFTGTTAVGKTSVLDAPVSPKAREESAMHRK